MPTEQDCCVMISPAVSADPQRSEPPAEVKQRECPAGGLAREPR
jgi:hypothetical protein